MSELNRHYDHGVKPITPATRAAALRVLDRMGALDLAERIGLDPDEVTAK